MSVEYCVNVTDDFADNLERIPDSEIEDALVETLRKLANAEQGAKEQQEELQRRMGLNPHKSEAEELLSEELARETRKSLRGEQRADPRLGQDS